MHELFCFHINISLTLILKGHYVVLENFDIYNVNEVIKQTIFFITE